MSGYVCVCIKDWIAPIAVKCFRFTSSVVPPHPHPPAFHAAFPPNLPSSSTNRYEKTHEKKNSWKNKKKERNSRPKTKYRIVHNKTQAKNQPPKAPQLPEVRFQEKKPSESKSFRFPSVPRFCHLKVSVEKNGTFLGRQEARSACRADPVLRELAEDFRADDDGHLGQVSLAQHLEEPLFELKVKKRRG